MKSSFILLVCLSIPGFIVPWLTVEDEPWDKDSLLSEVLVELGDEKPNHYRKPASAEEVKRGYELLTLGKTTSPDGKRGKRISKFFVCTDCHNLQREDPILNNPDPHARLEYAQKNNLPFLQGTTLWGIVNRESWYNDDYLKKYGQLVIPTNDTLENAIDLCCVECSKGRMPEKWEREAMLAYLYHDQIKLGDLELDQSEWDQLEQGRNGVGNNEAIKMLKTKYLLRSPAKFLDPQYGDSRKMGEKGDPKKGKIIWDKSCMHCHKTGRVTNFEINQDSFDRGFFKRHLKRNDNKSLYVITRRGTYALPGYKPYMPHYTEERMSKQQLEDLIAYCIKAAE